MPHLPQGRIAELTTEPQRAKSAGDLNAVFFVEYLRLFIASPCYDTIARLKRAVSEPYMYPTLDVLNTLLLDRKVDGAALATARDLAYVEFYRLVGAPYEDACMVKNGTMYLLKKALQVIQGKFGATV